MKVRNRRYIIRYNPTGTFANTPCWEVWDRRDPGGPYEGGYTQEGARLAAHFHNRQWHGPAYAKRT